MQQLRRAVFRGAEARRNLRRVLLRKSVARQRQHRPAKTAAGEPGTEHGRVLLQQIHELVERRRAVLEPMLRAAVRGREQPSDHRQVTPLQGVHRVVHPRVLLNDMLGPARQDRSEFMLEQSQLCRREIGEQRDAQRLRRGETLAMTGRVEAVDQRVLFPRVENPEMRRPGKGHKGEGRAAAVDVHEVAGTAKGTRALIEDAAGHADVFVLRVAPERGELGRFEDRGVGDAQ